MRGIEQAILAFAGLVVLSGAAPAPQPAEQPRVVLAVDGIAEPRNLPVLLAQQLGYFREQGLTVTLVDAPAIPSVSDLIGDGRADGAIAYYHHTFMAQLARGEELRS